MAVTAIDTETTGLFYYLGHRCFAITTCTEKFETQYLDPVCDSTVPLFIAAQNKDNAWVGHNLAFDLPFLKSVNIEPVGTLHDTMIAAHVYNPEEPTKGLKALAKKYCGRENHEEQKLNDWFNANGMRGKDAREYIKVPREIMEPYARADVEMTMALYKFYESKGVLDDPIYKLEMSVLPVVIDVVRQGMRVDREYVSERAMWSAERVLKLQESALKNFGVENLGSNDQLAELLFTRAGLVCGVRTDKGNPCLDDVELQKYNHEIVPMVQEYRELVKLNGTYLQAMLNKVDKEGVLHASLNQVGARTGRFSSSNPNIQNIPRSGAAIDIRRGFIARPDASLFLVDFSQIELRVLAHYCKEPVMLEALSTRAGDLHAATAKLLFNSVEKKYRTVAKTLNFATIYGAGAQQITDSLNKALPGQAFSVADARQFKADYFKSYPGLQDFIWRVEDKIRRVGFVQDLYGRKFPCSSEYAYRAVNYLIQGCSAGIFKKSMVSVHKHLLRTKSKLSNVVHDEMIFDLYNDEHHLIKELVTILEDHHEFRVPIFANAFLSATSWDAKKEICPHPCLASEAAAVSEPSCLSTADQRS
jgi:DNA polymerase-1